MRDILRYTKRIDAITAEDVQETVRTHLNTGRYISGRLLPGAYAQQKEE